ncbi:MAG TPA: hypothetical protein VFX47_04670, partial [Gammaproteobacteria bacterium]|nr:hypothetical protein [Gammaproteobacteria bacterium]
RHAGPFLSGRLSVNTLLHVTPLLIVAVVKMALSCGLSRSPDISSVSLRALDACRCCLADNRYAQSG